MKHLAAALPILLLAGCLTNPNRGLQLISGAGPVYPASAQAQGIEGEVVVVYDVTLDGEVTNARVVESTPTGVFDEAALAAVRSWRFKPPLVDGVAQPAFDRRSTVAFQIGGGDEYDRY
jgi:protein TonB